MAALAALEFVQASALIHDDVMDASDTRRGEPAVHRRFAGRTPRGGWGGDPDGVRRRQPRSCSATCAWSGPTSCCTAPGSTRAALARARPVFDQMRTEVIAGQYLDVLAQATGDTSLRAGLARWPGTSRRSTPSSGRCCSAPRWPTPRPTYGTAYSAYGLPLGEAFQLRDDMLGVFGDPARTGKPAGDDLREGKRTYLVAGAVDAADPRMANELREAGRPGPGRGRRGPATRDHHRHRRAWPHRGSHRRTDQAALAALDGVELANDSAAVLADLARAATARTG